MCDEKYLPGYVCKHRAQVFLLEMQEGEGQKEEVVLIRGGPNVIENCQISL